MKKQNTVFTFNFLLLTIFSVCSVSSVAQNISIKNNKLCKTNPISERPKMNLNLCLTMAYENKSAPLTMAKQSQTKPILPASGGKLAG
jgi:hypothetical protein